MTSGEGNDPVDRHVGSRIRIRRKLLKFSQKDLAARLGLSYQQVQKYENGSNRVSASVLHRMAHCLGVSILYFFEGAPVPNPSALQAPADPMDKPLAVEMMLQFSRIDDAHLRAALVDLVRKMAADDGEADEPTHTFS
ncbi:MAG: helix-turn-helix transcriptional regulator [Alphaproteobacteria bacterium]|nr:helix-turn-helix transcriptional regulator [Alphaproteobacteria bacterium]